MELTVFQAPRAKYGDLRQPYYPFDPDYSDHFLIAAERATVLVIWGNVFVPRIKGWYRVFQIDTRSLALSGDTAGLPFYGMPDRLLVTAQQICQQWASGGIPEASGHGYTIQPTKFVLWSQVKPRSDGFDFIFDHLL